jgi:putative SOS response-associated peptidase YedK
MCTRYVLMEKHLREVLARLGIPLTGHFASRYNIAPRSLVPAVRAKSTAAERECATLGWGLVPAWAKGDDSAPLVNARAETIASKPSFRDAFRKRRCIVPVSGFYEWEAIGRVRKPWLFRWRDEQPFGFAAVWESWRAPTGETRETCAIITIEPNALLRRIHDRMPVMLTPEQFEPWLDPAVTDPAQLAPLLRAPPAEAMSEFAVSPFVSNVRHEGPECLAPAPKDDPPQLSLGF